MLAAHATQNDQLTFTQWVAMQLTHAKPIKLPYSVGRGFG